jgi:hypothetical protein
VKRVWQTKSAMSYRVGESHAGHSILYMLKRLRRS